MQNHQAEFMRHIEKAKQHPTMVEKVITVSNGVADMIQTGIDDARSDLHAAGVPEHVIEKALSHFVEGRKVALQLAPAFQSLV